MNPKNLTGLVFPIAAVVLVVGASLAPSNDARSTRAPSSVAVTQSTYACPAGSAITLASGQVEAGTAGTATVLPSRQPQEALGGASGWRTAVADGAGVIVKQQGRGSGAAGFFAGTAPASGGGGLVVGPCPGPTNDAWLLGLGSGNKHFSTLILTNLAESPAVVDLTLWGPKGRIDAVDAEGVVVEPFSVQRIRLETLAAGESEIALHVHRRRGSVSAVVNDTSTATFKGTEPISSAQAPSRQQVIGGLVKGAAGRTLLVLNPGSVTARVDVEVIGAEGTFTPAGLEQVAVPAGTMQAVAVPETAGAAPQAIRLTSDQPVSSTVRMAPATVDYAYAEASAPLTGPALVPVDVGQGDGPPELLLTAPAAAATVDVEAFDAQMRSLGTTTVALAAGTTQVAGIEPKGAAYVVLRPTGDVIAAATYTRGDGVSSLALSGAPIAVTAPDVRPVG